MILCDTNVIIEVLKKNPLVIQTIEEISIMAFDLIERYAKSHSLQIPDALIAATSMNRDLQLYTCNVKDFIFIEKIRNCALFPLTLDPVFFLEP